MFDLSALCVLQVYCECFVFELFALGDGLFAFVGCLFVEGFLILLYLLLRFALGLRYCFGVYGYFGCLRVLGGFIDFGINLIIL